MAYVDQEYYDNEYLGLPVEDPREFKRMAKRASDLVDTATNFQARDVTPGGFQEEQVKKAVSAQIEHYVISGGYEASRQEATVESVTVGSFRYDLAGRRGGEDTKRDSLATEAVKYLAGAGLLYSGGVIING